MSAELPDATKQTKGYAWQLLARPQCRSAFISPQLQSDIVMLQVEWLFKFDFGDPNCQ